ncbi:MAG: hypothetical protein MZV65_18650 [Chromatiales bacterium]|nr:hypothetical protein [Chromatiales bacterium]
MRTMRAASRRGDVVPHAIGPAAARRAVRSRNVRGGEVAMTPRRTRLALAVALVCAAGFAPSSDPSGGDAFDPLFAARRAVRAGRERPAGAAARASCWPRRKPRRFVPCRRSPR